MDLCRHLVLMEPHGREQHSLFIYVYYAKGGCCCTEVEHAPRYHKVVGSTPMQMAKEVSSLLLTVLMIVMKPCVPFTTASSAHIVFRPSLCWIRSSKNWSAVESTWLPSSKPVCKEMRSWERSGGGKWTAWRRWKDAALHTSQGLACCWMDMEQQPTCENVEMNAVWQQLLNKNWLPPPWWIFHLLSSCHISPM